VIGAQPRPGKSLAGVWLRGYFRAMHVFAETERLLLRRFTESDVDNLVELDADPEVMRYITGGVPTPREVYENDRVPRYLRYYEQFTGYGFLGRGGEIQR
jgi:RimJ/RimL family protein N-acetyltransferase